MDAFSERRLGAAIVEVLRGESGEWVRARTVASALAADGFGPLEPLNRHVLPMLELLQMAGEVECLSAVGASGRSSYWRLPLVSAEGPGLTNELRV